MVAIIMLSVIPFGSYSVSAQNDSAEYISNYDAYLKNSAISTLADKDIAIALDTVIGSDTEFKNGKIIWNGEESIEFKVNISEDRLYNLKIVWKPLETGVDLNFGIMLDGKYPFELLEKVTLSRMWKNASKEPRTDAQGNEYAPEQIETGEAIESLICDKTGTETEPYKLALKTGEHSFIFEKTSQKIEISEISLTAPEQIKSYKELAATYKIENIDATVITLQGEEADAKSSSSFIPKSNNTDPAITLFKNEVYATSELFTNFKVEDVIPRDYWYNKLKRAKHYTIYPSWGENGATSLGEAFNQVKEICNKEESNFTYMYWDEPDTLMHEYGTTSQIVKVKLLEIEELVNKFAEEIPNETIVLITADHGLIDVEPLELVNYPDFMDCLIKPFAGEGRFAQFYVKEEKQEEFKELFNKYFSESFMLMSKEEFIKSQMAGLNEPNKIIEYALGDFVAIGTGNYYFTEQIKENDLVFKAHHAGLTPEEMETCVILLKRKDPKEEIEE